MKINGDKVKYFLIMSLFGCLAPVVKAVGFPSPVTACGRAWVSGLSLLLFILITKKDFDKQAVKKNMKYFLICGLFMAFDWIGLFEAYNYTSVATATVCYYTTPVIVFVASPFVLNEKFTKKHAICAAVAFVGMIFASGFADGGIPQISEIKGVLFALLGGISYACIILTNKKHPEGDPIIKTIIQLLVAGVITTPYILLKYDVASLNFSPKAIILLLVLGIGLTAIPYINYFKLIVNLPAKTVAIFSYMDPVVAVLISIVFLAEPITLNSIIGAVLILGSAIVSEM